jgi:hypothetical protein
MIMEQLVALPSEPVCRLGRARSGTNLSIKKGNLPTPIEKLEVLAHLIMSSISTDYTYQTRNSRVQS